MRTPKKFPNGKPVVVRRPANPGLARQLALDALADARAGSGDPELFNRIAEQCGPYTRLGYLSHSGLVILDDAGAVVGHVEPGDSFTEDLD